MTNLTKKQKRKKIQLFKIHVTLIKDNFKNRLMSHFKQFFVKLTRMRVICIPFSENKSRVGLKRLLWNKQQPISFLGLNLFRFIAPTISSPVDVWQGEVLHNATLLAFQIPVA